MRTESEILDSFVQRGLALIRVANGLAIGADTELIRLTRDLRAILATGVAGIGRRALLRLLGEVESAIAARFATIADRQTSVLADLLAAEAAFVVGAAAFDREASATALATLERDFTVLGTPLRQSWNNLGQDLLRRVSAEIRNAAAVGMQSNVLLSRVVGIRNQQQLPPTVRVKLPQAPRPPVIAPGDGGLIKPVRRYARATVDATVQTAGEAARFAVFRANGITAVKWHAILDPRVCPDCGIRAGKLWDLEGKPIGHAVPIARHPPQHIWCRCILLPLKFKDGKPPADGGDELNSFDDWLKGKSPQQQAELLGKGRAELYRAGTITLPDLINQAGQVMTLAELRALT